MTARHKLTTTERGYGWRHQQERERAKRAMESNGGAICWRCGKLITVDMQWDLGHDDVARDVVRGPEHRRCNRATIVHRGKPQPQQIRPRALDIFNT